MNSTLRMTLLGTGSSTGVPRIGGEWGACDPTNPRNRRMRCSALVELSDGNIDTPTTVLIDTSPDLREQALRAGVRRLDAVLFTHDHADQSHGIDDLRGFALMMRRRIPVHMDAFTARRLTSRFGYCFADLEGTGYPPILEAMPLLEPLKAVEIEGPGGRLNCVPLDQDHGTMRSLGFRFGPLAYCNDVVNLPQATMDALCGVDVLVVDALRYTPHPTHAHLDKALGWAGEVGARQVVLTNLHMDMDYQALVRRLPPHVVPGYDGLMIDITSMGVSAATRPAWPDGQM